MSFLIQFSTSCKIFFLTTCFIFIWSFQQTNKSPLLPNRLLCCPVLWNSVFCTPHLWIYFFALSHIYSKITYRRLSCKIVEGPPTLSTFQAKSLSIILGPFVVGHLTILFQLHILLSYHSGSFLKFLFQQPDYGPDNPYPSISIF